MNAVVIEILKGLAKWFFSLRVKRANRCEHCEDCDARYAVPGPGGKPVATCKHCIHRYVLK
jgi:hypothetical protein